MTVDELVDGLKALTLAEAEDLVAKLKEAFPNLAEMPSGGFAMPMMAGGGAAGPAVPEEEEVYAFNLVLTEVGAEKIQVIKAVRELTSLGLREAKEAVEGAPYTVLEGVEKPEAEAGLAKLKDAGATAEVKPA